MFDFLFGGTERINLTKRLLDRKGKDSSIAKYKLMSTPESLIAALVQVAVISQRRGALISQIIQHIENKTPWINKYIDPGSYQYFLEESLKSPQEADQALRKYINLRVRIDYPYGISKTEIDSDVQYAIEILMSWYLIQ